MYPSTVTLPASTPLSRPATIEDRRGPFGRALKHIREARNLSQSKLAERANFDHSYVSRLESGARSPTRDAVEAIVAAMGLQSDDHDRLLAAAGFLPKDVTTLLEDEPQAAEIVHLLGNDQVPESIRNSVRSQLVEIAYLVRLTIPAPAIP